MTDDWFSETLYTDFQQRLKISRVLYEEETEYQSLVIFENPRFGRVLTLDGIVQTTEGDEFIYHEMITHVPILAHGEARRVLIIGGGDGGALEEVLKHDVERAVMVEIDPKVTELSREYLPSICGKAFEDPRGELVIADGTEFVRDTDERFDVIIVDSTDPIGPAEVLFQPPFYKDCKRCLTERGVLITQSGVSFMQSDEARSTYRGLKTLFSDVTFYLAQVPTYGAGFMTLGWACETDIVRLTPPEVIEDRYVRAGLETRYYTPALHHASFALPGYIAALKE